MNRWFAYPWFRGFRGLVSVRGFRGLVAHPVCITACNPDNFTQCLMVESFLITILNPVNYKCYTSMTYPWYIILLPPKNRLVKQFSHDIPIFYPISPIYKTRFPLYSHQNIPIYPDQNPDLGKVIEFFHPDLPQKKSLATRWRLRFVPMFHVLSWGIPYALLMTGAPVTFTNRFTDPGRSGDGVSQGSRWLFTSQEWLKQKNGTYINDHKQHQIPVFFSLLRTSNLSFFVLICLHSRSNIHATCP